MHLHCFPLTSRRVSKRECDIECIISPETDFFHIGGTSLLLLGLHDKIKAEFELELSLVDLFETSTLSTMAGRIDGKSHAPEAVDWDAETRLSPSVSDWDSSLLQSTSKSSARVVVLTGATGYLGKALVQALEVDSTVKEIHCLGIRNATSRTDPKPFAKVVAHNGDLGHARLRLSEAMVHDLFGRADLVIRNGADTSYLKTYQSMRQSNYQTTRNLIEWCMPRMAPFHYISMAGVGDYAAGSPLRDVSMRSTPPPSVGDSTGYTACKWASEVFLENLVKRHPAWLVCVHRPTLISRDDIPQLDAVHNTLGFARKLGAVASSQGVARSNSPCLTCENGR
ncbi:male sterility protein-domain-containing protein [Xylaria sp. FL0933]|nr:male sterility protein-domain-containing protein [Xylaria sp. FL0933]